MRTVSVWLMLTIVLSVPVAAAEQAHGTMRGVKISESPSWFKESFLELEGDVAEASESGKRLMLYFHQEGCPYCARLVEENFTDPETVAYIKQHFDGISINMWGDREVVTVSGQSFSEKSFAAALKVQYTPTLIFLDEQGKVALRLNGYYPVERFRLALRYVAEKMERRESFTDYLLAGGNAPSGNLIAEDFFRQGVDLFRLVGENDKPLAVFFESADCEPCRIMHERILTDGPTRELVMAVNNVQLDLHSNQQVTTPKGRQLGIRQWAAELGISFTPSVVFFDRQGEEVMRISAFMKTFHFQSVFAYVLEKAYLQQPSFQRYLSARGEKIREAGYDTDIWGYESLHR